MHNALELKDARVHTYLLTSGKKHGKGSNQVLQNKMSQQQYNGNRNNHPGGGLAPKDRKKQRKQSRRNKQQEAVLKKQNKENSVYYAEVKKQYNRAQQNGGFAVARQQTTSESMLFQAQTAAGINFKQYDAITVETSGQDSETIQALTGFQNVSMPAFFGA
jgi:hypothetical protein